jgi:hypothetical protein
VIAGREGVLASMWKQLVQLTLVDFDSDDIFLPDDGNFDFLRQTIGFSDFKGFQLTTSEIEVQLPSDCELNLEANEVATLLRI